jgi:hypothetical protein
MTNVRMSQPVKSNLKHPFTPGRRGRTAFFDFSTPCSGTKCRGTKDARIPSFSISQVTGQYEQFVVISSMKTICSGEMKRNNCLIPYMRAEGSMNNKNSV